MNEAALFVTRDNIGLFVSIQVCGHDLAADSAGVIDVDQVGGMWLGEDDAARTLFIGRAGDQVAFP